MNFDFEKLFKASWEQFLKFIVKLILFVLVGVLLSLTIILIPTVAGGFTRASLALIREGKEPDFAELWNFDNYLQILLLMIIAGIAVAVGFMLLIVPGVILATWWMYSLYFIVDRNMSFTEAMSASKAAVSASGFFNNLAVLLIVSILNSIGSSLAGLGSLVTLPFGLLLMTNAYLEISGAAAPAAASQAPAKS